MQFGAPFSLTQNITLNLTEAEANGNLGTLAAGPILPNSFARFTGISGPVEWTLPAGSLQTYALFKRDSSTQLQARLSLINGTALGVTAADMSYLTTATVLDTVQANVVGVYNNGSSGVGAHLTTGLSSLTTNGGLEVANGDVIVLMGQTSANQNGLYVVSGVGTAIVLTRSAEFDGSRSVGNGAYACLVADTETFALVKSVAAPFGVGAIVIEQPSLNFEVFTEQGVNAPYLVRTVYSFDGGMAASDAQSEGLYDSAADILQVIIPVSLEATPGVPPDFAGQTVDGIICWTTPGV